MIRDDHEHASGTTTLARTETAPSVTAAAARPARSASHVDTASYRPDIDGLRAIAVLPVLFFHANVPGFTGGYVGVDVFFVISGYLITSIIWRELQSDRFSLVKFYERRVRRLLPALFVVLLATTAVGAWLLLPMDFRDLGRSLIAVAGFGSNVLFFKDTGYFDAPAELKPLLHTWSLAVEEQFYFFFPLFLLLARRRLQRSAAVFWLVVALALLSLCASVLLTPSRQSATFYLLPFRAWELLLGAALAFAVVQHTRPKLDAWLGIVGVAAIAFATFAFTNQTLFPGYAALVPCVGAALVIHSGAWRQGLAYNALSSPVLVFVGRISYSLYLWHWPIVVYVKYWTGEAHIEPATAAGIVVASLIAASLSFYFVERPFRDGRRAPSRRFMFGGAVAATTMWLGIGGTAFLTDGMPARLSDEVVKFATAAEDFFPAPGTCGKWSGDAPDDVCLIGAQDRPPTFLVWGDSHAGILVHGVEAAASKHGVSGLWSGIGGCPPLIGVAKDESVADAAVDAACEPHNAALLRLLETHREIETVILVSRWAYYAAGEGLGPEAANKVKIWIAPPHGGVGTSDNDAAFREGLTQTLTKLTALGKRVFVVQQVPELDGYASAKIARELARRGTDAFADLKPLLAISRARVEARQRPFTETIAAWQQRAGSATITVLGTRDFFCNEQECRALSGELPLYFDNNHVTTSTALALESIYEPVFAGRVSS